MGSFYFHTWCVVCDWEVFAIVATDSSDHCEFTCSEWRANIIEFTVLQFSFIVEIVGNSMYICVYMHVLMHAHYFLQ